MGAALPCQITERQELDGFRHAADSRHKTGIYHVDFLDLAISKAADKVIGNLLGILVGRTLADACIGLHHIIVAISEEGIRLAAYGNNLRRCLVLHLCHSLLEGVAGIGASQSLVGSQHQDEALALGTLLQQRMGKIPGIGGNIRYYLCHFICIRLVGNSRLLCSAQTGGCYHVHSICDLLNTLYALDTTAYIL